MATDTLSTSVSRRAMLAGGAAVPLLALPLPALAAIATVPSSGPDPDARLLRRVAVAERLRKRHARACRLLDRLCLAVEARSRYRAEPWDSLHGRRSLAAHRAGRYDLLLESRDLFWRYAAAVRCVADTPALTPRGLHAKLRLVLIAVRKGDARIYMYEDRDWIAPALADLKRVAGAEGVA